MSTVFTSRSLLYCFHIGALVNEVSNFFRVDMIPPIADEDSRLQLRTSVIVHHDIECERVTKSEEESENMMEVM
jgi:hypothetical protein